MNGTINLDIKLFYQELAQDSIHISLWKLGGDVGRSSAAVLSNGGLNSTHTQVKI